MVVVTTPVAATGAVAAATGAVAAAIGAAVVTGAEVIGKDSSRLIQNALQTQTTTPSAKERAGSGWSFRISVLSRLTSHGNDTTKMAYLLTK